MLQLIFAILLAFFAIPVIFVAGAAVYIMIAEVWDKFWKPIIHGKLPWNV